MLREALVDIRTRLRGGDLAPVKAAERSKATDRLRQAARMAAEELLAVEESGAGGLTGELAAERLQHQGPNQVAHERPPPWWLQLWHGFANAFSALLAVLATVSWVTGDHESGIIIAVMVAISGFQRFAEHAAP